jgi:hypothetical protein
MGIGTNYFMSLNILKFVPIPVGRREYVTSMCISIWYDKNDTLLAHIKIKKIQNGNDEQKTHPY